ncbi:MAG: NAD(P)/FAD-dependent oxidoreductase [Deltaproteobacteria bacterium]|nr:MAG: NAD(P)/FAD-dependent oxidoreductase [Deltaproteobacteria bacterium]
MERRDVVIVGSGPAGAATALGLATRAPELAARSVLLEKARHPRDKTCAGGVIPKGVQLLQHLDVPLAIPQARVDRARVTLPGGAALAIDGNDLCRVVRRRELDALLAWTARDRGVELREEERVTHVARDGAGVRVETSRRTYWMPVVVGADGSGSLVRRALIGASGVTARAVMCDVPVAATSWTGYATGRYEFDFSACATGLRGYRWAFPCVVDAVPHVNVGVYALPPVDGARLRAELALELGLLGAAPVGWQAFPIHAYVGPPRLAAPHALLVGDAAGVDPLMGEGISFALEYGLLAADALCQAHAVGDWSFRGYARTVERGPLGRKLRRLSLATRLFYGPRHRVWFRLAAASRRAQAVGLAWYNGVDGWDRRSALAALAALCARRSL